MSSLTPEQINRAKEVLNEYLNAPKIVSRKTPIENSTEIDKSRISAIENNLKPLLGNFLSGQILLSEFKSKIDGFNKRNAFWGFKGIKGQMFFNMVVNVADDEDECDQELKAAITLPSNEVIASSHIKTFESYVKRLGDQYVENGGSKHGRPKPGSIPFFLSYFWQIQDRTKWPVYYTNSVKTMEDLNLWRPSGDLAKDYLDYKHIHEELLEIFTKESKTTFGLYEVEHVFWYKGGNLESGDVKPIESNTKTKEAKPEELLKLPDGYVPPIISILPRIATNEDGLEVAAKASGTSLVRAFEKSINAAFTVLGYETKLLGQGQGRVPDGLAVDHDNSYAILWDAKIRQDKYGIGTDDRTIREYIDTQSRDLKRRKSLRNIYYAIISSKFGDDFDDVVRTLKMDTNINEVVLIEASALVVMVDNKLRSPQLITLGPDGIQRLFSTSGIISADIVLNTL